MSSVPWVLVIEVRRNPKNSVLRLQVCVEWSLPRVTEQGFECVDVSDCTLKELSGPGKFSRNSAQLWNGGFKVGILEL